MIRRGRTSILVVDTDKGIREQVRRQLASDRYYVAGVDTAESALRLAARLSVDLLIVDVFLPGLRGRELLDKLGALQPGIKALFTSYLARGAHLHDDFCPMNCALITKPFTAAQLAAKVAMVLAYHRCWKDQAGVRRDPPDPDNLLIPLEIAG